ncbi:MAG: YeeE/YedE family protein [Thauera sp.]|jgi:uncharacterized membrane protein YedE/YeeE
MNHALVSAPTIVWLGFAIGAVFGAASQRSGFCTMGAVSDVVNIGDWTRMRMWALAVAVAIVGTGALQALGLFDPAKTIYTGSRLPWLSHLVGGFAFGVGMTLASGCAGKTLIRIGGGNLKSVVVFAFLAIGASMTLRGLSGVWRVTLLDPVALQLPHAQTLPAFLAAGGLDARSALLAATTSAGGGLLAWALASRDVRRAEVLLGGLFVGLAVVAGWYVTGHLGHIGEHPDTLEEVFLATNSGRAESLSFVAPHAYTLELLLLWSDASRKMSFGIASALGVIAGAAAMALATRSFRIESFRDAGDLVRHIAGGLLMGFGGVTALGCTLGQGVSGLSTLALGAALSTLAIVAGATATMKLQYWLMTREP